MYKRRQSRYHQPGETLLPPGFARGKSKSKYFLMQFLLISPTNHRTQHYIRSTKNINKQKAQHIDSGYWYIAHPFSKFRTFWEILMAIMYFLQFLAVPYDIAFGEAMERELYDQSIGPHRFMIIFLRILYAIFILDIIVNFFTGIYENTTKNVILDPKTIAKRYITGYFWIDFLSSLPVDDILLYGFSQVAIPTEVLLLAECMGLLKILRLKTFLRFTRQIIQMMKLGDTMLQEFTIILLLSFIFLHWMGILHYTVACIVLKEDSWVITYRILGMIRFERYRHALFRAIANMLKTGFGQGEPTELWDMFITCFTIVSGAILRSYITAWRLFVGTVLIMDIFIKYTAAEYGYLAMLDQLQSFMSHKKLPPDLQRNILMKFEFSYQKRYFREETVLSTLPANLRMEIKDYICRPLVEAIDFFYRLSEDAIYDVIAALKREIFLPKYVIIRAGTRGDSMYIIRHGTVEVVSQIGRRMKKLVDGDFFGEIALVAEDNKRIATIIAVDICEIYRLDRRDFELSVLANSEATDLVKAVAAERLKQTLIEEEKHLMEQY